MKLHGCSTRLRAFAVILACLTSIFGCESTINPKPFQDFQNSVETLRDGSNAAVEAIIPITNDRFEADTGASIAKFSEDHKIKLDKSKEPYQFIKVPLYLRSEHLKDSLWDLTNSVAEYANVLVALASKGVMTETEFTNKINELNGNNFSAYLAFQDESKGDIEHTQAAKNSAILSTFAISAFKEYLQNKKESEIIDAIEKNHTQIELFSSTFIDAIQLIRDQTESEYNVKVGALEGLYLDKKSSAIKQYMALNRRYYAQLKALQVSAQTLPVAHRQLISAVKTPGNPMSALVSLVNYGKQLKKIADNAQKTSEQQLLERSLEPSEAEADALSAEAILANHKYAKAQVEAVKARIKADADSDDIEKEQKAKNLEKEAEEFKAIAEQKTAAAQKMREAVDVLKAAATATLTD